MNRRQPPDRNAYALAVISVGLALVILFVGASVIAAVGKQVPKELWTAASALSGALVGLLVEPPGKKSDHQAAAAAAAAAVHSAASAAATGKANEIASAGIVPDASVVSAARSAAADINRSGSSEIQAAIKQIPPRAAASYDLPKLMVDAAIAVHTRGIESASRDPRFSGAARDAAKQVHQAAADAAGAAQEDAILQAKTAAIATASSLQGIWKVIAPLVLFLTSATFALLILAGAIHPTGCLLNNRRTVTGCDAPLLGAGHALLALASASAGALVGLFANPPRQTSKGDPPA